MKLTPSNLEKKVVHDYGWLLKYNENSSDIWIESACFDEKDIIRYPVYENGNIIERKAYNFIREKGMDAFQTTCGDAYENYKQLFYIMGIQKRYTFFDYLTDNHITSQKMSDCTHISLHTIKNLRFGLTEFSDTSVENGIKIARFLNTSVEELSELFKPGKRIIAHINEVHRVEEKIKKLNDVLPEITTKKSRILITKFENDWINDVATGKNVDGKEEEYIHLRMELANKRR